MIEIKLMANGVWRVRLGLIQQEFLLVESAVEWIQMKMLEQQESWINSAQNTVGT